MYRWDVINRLIKKYNYKSYLEIGTWKPEMNFDKIKIDYKYCIDPNPVGKIDFIGTSDEYFNSISDDVKFDIIFVDGLHLSEQVIKDVENSLKHLNPNGTIVCHDCLPFDEQMQKRQQIPASQWTGDVWKAIAHFRINRTDLSIKVIDCDFGIGVIQKGYNVPYQLNNNLLDYEYYHENKKELLNVITPLEFLAPSEHTTLNDIGLKYGTDKSSLEHDYLKKYEKLIPYKRSDNIKILEIGVLNGSSVKTWEEYFYNSQVVGIDINPECKKYEKNRISIEIGSQVDGEFLESISKKYGQFDFIIDDGSHINHHVIYSFEKLFDSVKPGGLYIIEDVCTSYWEHYGGKLKMLGTMVEYFKNTIDEVNFAGEIIENKPSLGARREDYLYPQFQDKGYECFGMYIESIMFLNSIIIITKK